jgi:hypothetical protein
MDSGLRLVAERCCQIINSYLYELNPDIAKTMVKERFHLIQAKQALMKCINVSDPSDFAARRLIKVYDEQLAQLVRHEADPDGKNSFSHACCPTCRIRHYRNSDFCSKCDPELFTRCPDCSLKFRKSKRTATNRCATCRAVFQAKADNIGSV